MTMVELEKVHKPLWATVQTIQELFGVPPKITRQLAYEARIRQAKLGEAQQSTRLYRVADVEEWLESKVDLAPKGDHA
jgi:hypothetical protein